MANRTIHPSNNSQEYVPQIARLIIDRSRLLNKEICKNSAGCLLTFALKIYIWNKSLQLGLREWVHTSPPRIAREPPHGEKIEGIL